MLSRQPLAVKLAATGLAFLLVALGSIALTLWVTWQLEGGAAAVNEAGRLRMLSYRMQLEAARGAPGAWSDSLVAQTRVMDTTLELVRVGDPSRPLFIPWNDATRTAFDAVQRHWPELRAQLLGVERVDPTAVHEYVNHIDVFVSVVEHRLSYWTQVLRGFQFTMLALTIVTALLMFYVAHVTVLEPLRRLGSGVERVRAGDFSARVAVTSDDEFGELSHGFNGMAERLQALYRGLEDKVAEKTAHLEIERARLASLYEVSDFVARAETLDDLARGFVAKLRRIVSADAVVVRWSDQSNQRYLLLAQDGLPSPLAREEQCLPAGGCHCGQPVTGTGARVVPIRADHRIAPRCRAAGFETLLTVPLRLHHRILGEIDLFYRGKAGPGSGERSLVEALASHLAGGIESLRVAAAEKEAAVSEERALLARELHDSIAQSLAFLKIEVTLLRDAESKGDTERLRTAIDEIDTGVRECYGDVRELLLHFRTRADGEDIEHALRTTLQKFEHQTGLRTRLVMDGHGVALPADVQVQALHVVQEALSNVRKHAGAREVCISVQPTPDWRFEIADDGSGFDTQAQADESHVGLRIMRERAQRIGAAVAVHSQPGGGTRVVLTVPHRATPLQENPASELAASTAGR